MRTILYATVALIYLVGSNPALSAAPPTGMEAPDPETAARLTARMQDSTKKAEAPISFYGQVIDQDHKPVDNAEIKIEVLHYDPTEPENFFKAWKRFMVTTDTTGRFSIENEHGLQLSVDTITKSGFDFAFSSNLNRSFDYDHRHGKIYAPDKNNPALFHLRKIGPTSFVLEQSGLDAMVAVRPDGNATVGAISSDPNYFWLESDWQFPGFAVSATLAKDTRDWVLAFKGKHEGDSVALLDHIVYEAPEQGYTPSAELKISLQKNPVPGRGPTYPHEIDVWLLVQSAKPKTFTRVGLRIHPRQEEKCDIRYKITLNPYGERSFERESSLDQYWEAQNSLRKQAVHALCNGQLPPKPDIPKLIQEAKEKKANQSGMKQ